MKVLFVGGSGIISSACTRLAVQRGIDLHVLNRGSSTIRPLPDGVTVLRGDIRDPSSARSALAGHTFDAVVDWVAFTPEHVLTDVELFQGRTGQYVFISSASAYQTPPARLPIVAGKPLSRYTCTRRSSQAILSRLYCQNGLRSGEDSTIGRRAGGVW